MRTFYRSCIFYFIILSCSYALAQGDPRPIGPTPSQRQLDWHDMEYYAFIHFNMNTFTNMEWGEGGESPETFNPSALDARQWARVVKEAGMKGIILTAKHHDGFALWPTETTEHSVKNSPWKNGEGDVLKELAEATKEQGLKMGIYLSPWDRNHPEYGREEYVEVFHTQLEELLTNYGDLFEIWFDGANGGTGYYGGANEERKIDNKTYYQWDKVVDMVRKYQPNAVIFSDSGPDVRWVGNEKGIAGKTNWSIIRRDEVYPGWPRYRELQYGHEDGTHWVPAEADVSIRPGWYYHPQEDHLVKSLPHLLDIYYGSIGRNASLLLNLPVDKRGIVHETDIEQLMKLREKLNEDFKTNIVRGVDVKATSLRGKASKFAPANLIDGAKETYWAPKEGQVKASVVFDFKKEKTFNRFLVQEYIPLGQRVKEFSIEGLVNGKWQEIERQTTIGYKRILRFDPVTATGLRFKILDAKASPLISNIEVYHAPALLVAPEIRRSMSGEITLHVPDERVDVFYTLDESEPDMSSRKYAAPISGAKPVVVKAVAYDPETGEYSEVKSVNFDVAKENWKVVEASSGELEEASKTIDENMNSWWATSGKSELPQEIVIDLGREYDLRGFTYSPPQKRYSFGVIADYEFEVSSDNRDWEKVASGEFGNIKNNPIEQTVDFEPVKGRYIKLRGIRTTDDSKAISIGEFGVITANKG